jgi:hypothetical protein
VFFNETGVGKDNAGIAALGVLEDVKVPAGAMSHLTAHIG